MKIIYCDGSSLGNPGRGGFAVLAIDTDRKKYWEYGEGVKLATNNQMELHAALFALKLILKSDIKKVETIEMRLDSKYVIQGITVWSKNWVKNNWKSSQKKDVLNKEIWMEILKVIGEIKMKHDPKISWVHVYGHSGETWNERVDVIAKGLAGGEKVELAKGVDMGEM